MARILVVEDDRNIRFLVATLLAKLEYDVEEAENGIEALAVLERSADFDILVTDLQMPHLDGVDLIEAIKANYPNLHIIAISAYDDRLADVRAIGVDSSIRKPFSHHQLVDVIHSVARGLMQD